MSKKPITLAHNRLLDALLPESKKRVLDHLQHMNCKLGDIICEAGEVLKYVYFPTGAVISLLTVLQDGFAIETANIGSEGAFGLFAAMYNRASFNRSIIQLEGGMARIPIHIIRKEFEREEYVRNLFVSYSETELTQVQQTSACNAIHTTEERICRWLLMMHDRAEDQDLPYTHEFLSGMLGANRKSVTLAAQALQTSGLISYQRGKIKVTNRKGLEKASCECYAVVRERYDEFIKTPKVAYQTDTKGKK